MPDPTAPFDIEAMRRDRKAGTRGEWWVAGKRTIRSGERHWIAKLFWSAWEADARRIARVPAMEAEIERLTAAAALAGIHAEEKRLGLGDEFDGARAEIERQAKRIAELEAALSDLAGYDAFHDREYLSAALNAKLDRARAALSGAPR